MRNLERSKALADGQKFYTTGRPCKHGHLGKRYAVDGKCYDCHLVRMNENYKANKPDKLATARKHYVQNRDRLKEKSRRYYQENREIIAERAESYRKRHLRRILDSNRAYVQLRKSTDPVFAAALRMRSLLGNCMRVRGFRKGSSTEVILGCTWEEFAKHLERQFLKGMGWHNRHLWHIDHITPMATARTAEEAERLNHVSNLRPVWARDNLRKQDRVEFLI